MKQNELQREEVNPGDNVSPLAVVITELGLVLPAKRASAQAIEQLRPRDRISLKATDDGHIEFADEFNSRMEIFLWHAT